MSMRNNRELSNALNPNISLAAYAQHYASIYAQPHNAFQISPQHQVQQQQQQQELFQSSPHNQYTQPQYQQYHRDSQEPQSQSQQSPTTISNENLYTHPAEQQGYEAQQTPQVYSATQEQQHLLSHLHQSPQHHQLAVNGQQHSYGASQTHPQTPTYSQGSYSAGPPQALSIQTQYTPTFGDGHSNAYTATPDYSTLASYITPTTSYGTQTTTSINQSAQPPSQYSQYPSPHSAHTTPHVQHHQVSSTRDAVPVEASPSGSTAILRNGAYREQYSPVVAHETPARGNPYPPAVHDGHNHAEASCDYTGMLPTPALEPRHATPAAQSHEQQQPQPSEIIEPASEQAPAVSATPALLPQQVAASSAQRQQQQHTDKMVQALPMFMMETFKVIRKEKDANEEERKRRVAWEEAHEERQRRLEAEVEAQNKKVLLLEEKLAKLDEEQMKRDAEQAKRNEEQTKRDEEQAKRNEEQVKRDEALAKRDQEQANRHEEHLKRDEELSKKVQDLAEREEQLKQERQEVKDKLKDVEGKMAEMLEMIQALEAARVEAARVAASVPPAPVPVVATKPPSIAAASPVPAPASVAAARQPAAATSQPPGNASRRTADPPPSPPRPESPEPFSLSPDLDAIDIDSEPDLPPVSSIRPPPPGPPPQVRQLPVGPPPRAPLAQPPHQPHPPPHPNHSMAPPPPFYPYPMASLHAQHQYRHPHAPPPPAPYHYQTPGPYYSHPPPQPHHQSHLQYAPPPNYNAGRLPLPPPPPPPPLSSLSSLPPPALPPHAVSRPPVPGPSNHHAAAQYITPNLTPDLPPATVIPPPVPQTVSQDPPRPHEESVAPKKRKAKSKHSEKKKKKKKRKKRASDDEWESDSESESDSYQEEGSSGESEVEAEPKRRPKRVNGHDKMIYTLPHALRQHMTTMMDIISDKELPDSHDESTPYHPSQPIRFVWEKTCKQSVHNARMKVLVLEDIKEKRASLYPKVPAEEFANKAVLDKKFDNCFETMRGKYKAQRSEELAQKEREREAKKARVSRHSARKSTKLSDRSESRVKMPKYEAVVFDPALMRECMSSDESDVEIDPVTQVKTDIQRSRGPSWRSRRLIKFYGVLEDNKAIDPNVRPKTGAGKKRPRRVGPPKDEFILPPKGIAPWMLSRRWVERERKRHIDLDVVLGKLVADEHVLDGEMYEELGEESDVEDDGDDGDDTREVEMRPEPVQDEDQGPLQLPATQAGLMRTLKLGVQRQSLEVGPAFSGRYTLQ